MKELEKEFSQTNGWLKIQKLNELSGKSAREELIVKTFKKQKKSVIDTSKPVEI